MSWDPNQSGPAPWESADDATAAEESPAAAVAEPAEPAAEEGFQDRPPADADPLLRIREEQESEEIQQLREQGRIAINLLSQLVRNYQLYAADNAIFERPLVELHTQLLSLFDRLGEVRLVVVEGQPYVGVLRIRIDPSTASAVHFLGDWLERTGLGGWGFGRPTSPQALGAFLALVARTRFQGPDPVAYARTWLSSVGFDWMDPIPPQRYREEGEEILEASGGMARANQVFENGVAAARGFFGMLRRTGVGSVLDARKAIQFVVDMAIEEQGTSLALGMMAELGDPLLTHSMHVANLSVAVGQELGVPRHQLAELGLCGLLHDTGLSELPQDLDGDAAPTLDGARVADHPVHGFRLQLRQKGYHPGRLLRAVVSLEHHMEYDGNRPEVWDDPSRPVHPFSRIVAVAEAYDTLLTATDQRAAMQPARALTEVWRGRKSRFDPVAVQALVNVMGRYPVGSTLKLSDGSIGVVTARGDGPDGFDRPAVRIVHAGDRLRAGEDARLETIPAEEVRVIGDVDPALLELDVLNVLLQPRDQGKVDGEGGDVTRGTSE